MKTLLVPTDFTYQSLQSIPTIAQQYYPQKLNIVLVHMLKITDSISELLMLSRRSAEYRHIPDNFYIRCRELEKDYSHLINKISIDFFYGSTLAVFNNYLDGHQIDGIVTPHDNYQLLFKNSIDPQILITRCGKRIIPVTETAGLMTDVFAGDPELIEQQ
ncbi:hypothetical protein [Mucilaginibacter pocheonensis]|uniref:Universal stress protein family protein n=1 Tax=Mucilaginibacter pocheonensis TaxID=398050 RepID=A0ABU1T764_9SPHI|nr:hypothetical protein [Mucilaginibacter pocheonensis]MDR6941204.1 hypothetical protein [Mucilaginibacter pocheonensis]